jgi:bifunctional non-homologous end joining protein LigD
MTTKTRMKTKRRTQASPDAASVRITHPERVVYPQDGITKGDLADYYRFVADWMMPHIADRPLSLVRCPAGTADDCFFQKHPSAGLPKTVGRVAIREKSGTDDYQTVHDSAGLLTLVQFNAVEIHVWGAKNDRIEQPDRIVFDIDPDVGLDWSEVVDAARLVRRLLDELGLATFLKTTGGKGLHVVSPIRPQRRWDEIKQFCRDVVVLLQQLRPDRYVVNMSKAQRRGKIFLDYLRNDRGSTWVAPYSTRARPGATVSTPIDWKELGRLKSSAVFTLESIPRRLKSRRSDPWKDLARSAVSLSDAMLRAVRSQETR